MRWNVMVIVSRCSDGVMREDEASAHRWPGQVLLCQCTLLTHGTRGGSRHTLLCLVSPPYIRLLTVHSTHTVFACLASFYTVSWHTPAHSSQLTSCSVSWLARRDLRIPRPSPLLSGQPLAKQQNTSVFGKYTREQFWTRKMIAKLCWFFRWCNCSGNIKYPPIVRSGSSPDSFPCHEPTV